MRPPLDQWAGYAAAWLVGWLAGRVAPEQRVWVVALWGDLESIERGWDRLTWAIGGIPLAWRLGRRRAVRAATPAWSPWTWRSVTRSVVLDGLFVVAYLGVLNSRLAEDWSRTAYIGAALASAVLALSLRRKGAAFVTAGVAVFWTIRYAEWWAMSSDIPVESQLVFGSFGGVRLALTLGLLLGAFLEVRAGAASGGLRRLRALLDGAQRTVAAASRRVGVSANALAVGVSFFFATVVNDLVFIGGYQARVDFQHPLLRSWRPYPPLQDTQYLLGGAHLTLLAAVAGVALGVFITRHGRRNAIRV